MLPGLWFLGSGGEFLGSMASVWVGALRGLAWEWAFWACGVAGGARLGVCCITAVLGVFMGHAVGCLRIFYDPNFVRQLMKQLKY